MTKTVARLAIALIVTGLAGASPVQAQSMNIPMIVVDSLTQVCGPWMQTGDRGAAMRAAQALGYTALHLHSGEPVAEGEVPSAIVLDGSLRHRGRIILIESRDRVCSVDMAEAGAGQISEAAAPHLQALGLRRVLNRADGGVQVVVWAGDDRQAVMAPSYVSSGAAMTLTWLRPN